MCKDPKVTLDPQGLRVSREPRDLKVKLVRKVTSDPKVSPVPRDLKVISGPQDHRVLPAYRDLKVISDPKVHRDLQVLEVFRLR